MSDETTDGVIDGMTNGKTTDVTTDGTDVETTDETVLGLSLMNATRPTSFATARARRTRRRGTV